MTADSFSTFGKYIEENYEIHEYRNASIILAYKYRKEFNDIKSVLENFTLNKSDLLKNKRAKQKKVSGEGDKTTMSKKLNGDLISKGWKETEFHLSLLFQKYEVKANFKKATKYGELEERKFPTHGIDAFKNRIGVEVEWNNKTEFYDRDLGNFRLLHELKLLDVGIIITRCDHLQSIFKKNNIGSSYGSSTTILSKCVRKADAGRAGSCPLLLFGISNKLYRDEK